MVLHFICVAQHLAALLGNRDISPTSKCQTTGAVVHLRSLMISVFYVYRMRSAFIQDPIHAEVIRLKK